MKPIPTVALFGTVERRLFRTTAVLFGITVLVGLIAVIFWTLGVVLARFYSLVMPLCVAGILALVLNPLVNYLERLKWLNRVAACLIVVLSTVAAAAGLAVMVAPALLREIVLFIDTALPILVRWQENAVDHFPGLARMALDSAQGGEIMEVMPDLQNAGKRIKAIGGTVIGLSFVPLLLFFALLSGKGLHARITKVLSVFSAGTQTKIIYFIDVFLAQVTGFFQGQLVIAVTMGVMFAVGFSLIGLKGAILIGLLLGMLNIVPFLGTLIGLMIVLPLAYIQPSGGFGLLGLSLLVFTLVQLMESWVLTPKIMADRSGLHPALVVISVFFWGIAFGGLAGMVLAVPLTAFLIAAWRQAKPGLARSMTWDHEATRIETPGRF